MSTVDTFDTLETFAYSNFTLKQQMLQMNHSIVRLDDLIDKKLLKIEVFIMTTVFILALVGNSIVILTFLLRLCIKNGFRRNKLSRMNFYIFHLSVADVYVSLGNILTMLIWRQNNNMFFGGDLACKLVVYFQVVSVYYSTYVLITMSIDRYEAICKPFIGLTWSKKRGKTYIIVAFILAHLQGIPQVGLFRMREIPKMKPVTSTCFAVFTPLWLEKFYVIYTWVMQFILPLIIIVFCYVSISINSFRLTQETKFESKQTEMSIRRTETESTYHGQTNNNLTKKSCLKSASSMDDSRSPRQLSMSNQSSNIIVKYNKFHTCSFSLNSKSGGSTNNVTIMRRHCSKNFNTIQKFKTIKLTLTVITLYIICNTPYFVGVIMSVMIVDETLKSKLRYPMVLSCLLFQLNSCVNPWIYLTFNFKIDSFRKLLRGSYDTKKHQSLQGRSVNSRTNSQFNNV